MAHEINASDRFGEVRVNGQRAWHGLGMEIEEGLTAVEAFPKIGLDWHTALAPVTAQIAGMGPDGPTTVNIPLKGTNPPMAHLRIDDQGSDHRLLGMVTQGYKPMENMDLARFADALSIDGVEVETAGSLYNSRRVFCLVKLPNLIRATKDDVLENYILIQNGHGGTAALSCYPTAVRVVCANTLRWSETDLAKGIRFQHSGDFDEKLSQARSVLGTAVQEAERFQEQVTALVGKRLSAEETSTLLQTIADKTFGRLPDEFQVSGEVREKLILKRTELIGQWEVNLANSRQSMAGIRGTAWAALNAVTEFHDHDRGRYAGVDESDARIGSNIFGVSHRAKVVAFKEALATV
tara:strand:- start:20387 stop:21439 length:1053 start_codon:yes stop_codon:yes gene_type:complete